MVGALAGAICLALRCALALGARSELFDSLSSLQFRNPPDGAVSRAADQVTHREQCVLYSEIDNVSSINKGWDVGSGVGWNLSYPYAANGTVPPTGIRSAVPLGGMATGNFEVRADGSFRQWCIESQSPGGGAKLDIGALNEATLGVRVNSKAALLRTHPPAGLPGVAGLRYEGAVPVSKLTVEDSDLPAALALYAHGEIVPWEHDQSLTPAVSFTLTAHNPTRTPIEVALLLSLPLASQPETARVVAEGSERTRANASTVLACKALCDSSVSCVGWSLEAAECYLIRGGVPQNVFAAGVTSGIKGSWTHTADTLVHDRAIPAPPIPPPPVACSNSTTVQGYDIAGTLVKQPSPVGGAAVDALPVAEGQAGYNSCRRTCCSNPLCKAWVVASPSAPPGAAPAPCSHGKPCCWHKGGKASISSKCSYCTSSVWDSSGSDSTSGLNEQVGNFALHVPNTNPDSKVSFMTADTLPGIFERFSQGGSSSVSSAAVHGAVSSSLVLQPGENRTITIVFGWHFSTRYFTGASIGNYYTRLHKDAASAAQGMGQRLEQLVETYRGWHAAFFEASSLPAWLQDVLVNSMSQWRSAFKTADGRWRQWEAYDCVDVDSVHNDYQRQMPYALFFPEFVKNTMSTGWKKLQQSNGMITESLSGGCMGPTGTLDSGGGRVMGDVSTIFLIEVLQLYEWTNDPAFLDEMASAALRAGEWFMNIGTAGTPLPHKQCCTYDIIDFANYDHTAYNSFLYLAALRAGERLGAHLNNRTFSLECERKIATATKFMVQALWNQTHQYFRAWQDAALGAPPWVMADTLYGQVLANTLGLESNATTWLVDPKMIESHLHVEATFNPSPYGLTVVTTSGQPPMPRRQLDGKQATCSEATKLAKYDSVWMGGAPDWAALQIALGEQGVGLAAALAMAEKELDHWRTDLRDQWNIHGLTANDGYGVDGQPWCTAHYGFHMPIWHIPFAMSGQRFSALANGTISFAPKLTCPFKLPFLTPGGVGTIGCGKDAYELTVTLGKLRVERLSVRRDGRDVFFPTSADVATGESISWPIA